MTSSFLRLGLSEEKRHKKLFIREENGRATEAAALSQHREPCAHNRPKSQDIQITVIMKIHVGYGNKCGKCVFYSPRLSIYFNKTS